MQQRPFPDFLRELEGGRLIEELSEELANVVSAVQHTGKKGTLGLDISISYENDGQMQVQANVKSKPPINARPKSLMFVRTDGVLQRADPRQSEIDLRAVKDDKAEGQADARSV